MSPVAIWTIVAVNVGLTALGDALIKVAADHQRGMLSPWFVLGVVAYSVPVVGWFFLMRELSLIQIGVVYSAATIILLTAVAVVVFREPLQARSLLAVSLAIAAVVVGGKG